MLIKNEPAIITGYLEDASGFRDGRAERVVIPETEAEIADYLAQAGQRREPVTVSAGGTGVAAGRIPLGGTLRPSNAWISLRPSNPPPPEAASPSDRPCAWKP